MLANVETETLLPAGFTTRPATMDDLDAVVNVIQAHYIALIGVPEFDANDLRTFLTNPSFDLTTSTLIIEDAQGNMAAYAEVNDTSSMPVRPVIWGCVHPDYNGLGCGSTIMQWGEQTLHRVLARVPADLRVATGCYTLAKNKPAGQLFIDHGYQLVRHWCHMEIELEQEPAKPIWPEGITLTTFNEHQDLQAIVAATKDGFRDHWGFVDEWQHRIANNDKHDPTLWFLAMEGDEITAVSLCAPYTVDNPKMGRVEQLAVRRPWRRRGLGLAILQHSIYELYKRGQTRVGLGVDSDSLTGAARLYEKAGMHTTRLYDSYEKELRPGRIISTQSVENP